MISMYKSSPQMQSNDDEIADSSTSSSAAMETPTRRQNPNVLWVIIKGILVAFIVFIFFLLLGIATAAILHFVIAGGALYSRRPRRRSLSSSCFDSDPAAYTVEELRRLLPCFEYSDGDDTTTKDCAICLDNFRQGERIRRLPNCNHTFHSNCVEKMADKSIQLPDLPTPAQLHHHR